jgi:hypothetical protein
VFTYYLRSFRLVPIFSGITPTLYMPSLGVRPRSDLWLLTLVAYEKRLLSLQKIDLKKKIIL